MSEEVRLGGHNTFPSSQGWQWGWQPIPGSPLEAGIFYEDPFPSLRLRWNEEKAQQWFERMLENNIHHIGYSLRYEGWIE